MLFRSSSHIGCTITSTAAPIATTPCASTPSSARCSANTTKKRGLFVSLKLCPCSEHAIPPRRFFFLAVLARKLIDGLAIAFAASNVALQIALLILNEAAYCALLYWLRPFSDAVLAKANDVLAVCRLVVICCYAAMSSADPTSSAVYALSVLAFALHVLIFGALVFVALRKIGGALGCGAKKRRAGKTGAKGDADDNKTQIEDDEEEEDEESTDLEQGEERNGSGGTELAIVVAASALSPRANDAAAADALPERELAAMPASETTPVALLSSEADGAIRSDTPPNILRHVLEGGGARKKSSPSLGHRGSTGNATQMQMQMQQSLPGNPSPGQIKRDSLTAAGSAAGASPDLYRPSSRASPNQAAAANSLAASRAARKDSSPGLRRPSSRTPASASASASAFSSIVPGAGTSPARATRNVAAPLLDPLAW